MAEQHAAACAPAASPALPDRRGLMTCSGRGNAVPDQRARFAHARPPTLSECDKPGQRGIGMSFFRCRSHRHPATDEPESRERPPRCDWTGDAFAAAYALRRMRHGLSRPNLRPGACATRSPTAPRAGHRAAPPGMRLPSADRRGPSRLRLRRDVAVRTVCAARSEQMGGRSTPAPPGPPAGQARRACRASGKAGGEAAPAVIARNDDRGRALVAAGRLELPTPAL